MKKITIQTTGVRQQVSSADITKKFSLYFPKSVELANSQSPSNDGIMRLNSGSYISYEFDESNKYNEIRLRGNAGDVIYILYDVLSIHDNSSILQDQTSEPIDLYLCNDVLETEPTTAVEIDEMEIDLASVTGATVGDCINISENGRTYQAVILAIDTLTVTVNAPFDYAFSTDAVVKIGKWNMNVNGSAASPIIYKLCPPAGVKRDINRIIVGMMDDAAMDDGKFGGITSLTNGLVFRIKNGYHKNLFIVNDNGGFRERSFDAQYLDKAPAGSYGFGCRKTFNGQDKSGVTIRLNGDDGDELQVIIQDNLTALTKLAIVAQGHVVED